MSCYHKGNEPILFCGELLDDECYLESNTNSTDLSCSDTTHICYDFLPTPLPTIQPTFSPTKYDPQKEPNKILFVSKNNTKGCDVGNCFTNFNNNSINYCELSELTDFNYSMCCVNDNYTMTQIQIYNTTYECNETDHTLKINKTGIFTQSVMALGNLNKDIEILCFEIDEPFICYNPKLTEIRYEQIPMITILGETHYLNIGYQSETNHVNKEQCGEVSRRCGAFSECAIDNQLTDIMWTFEGGPYAFYLINGPFIRAECDNPKRSMNVELSVSCSSVPSICRTFQYSWQCLHGNVDSCKTCNNEEYDGNGMIQMDIGEYTFNNSIHIKNQQIRIQGSGMNKTIFYHNTNNDTIVSCYFRQCYITISDLSYYITSLLSQILFKVTNGGNVKFENVYFSNISKLRIHFIFSDYCNVLFKNCIFEKQMFIWDIIQNANVTFINCIINDIISNPTQSIFTVYNSQLFIYETVFMRNNHLFSILSTHEASHVIIKDCIFQNNTNNAYIWYSTDSNTTLLNTPFDISNDCGINHDHCFVFIDSDLFIDNVSAANTNIQFAHNMNNSNEYPILYLVDVDPKNVDNKIDFNFGKENGTIIFMPCNPFESDAFDNTLFGQISYQIIATHLYTQSGAFYKSELICNDSQICYIKCVTEVLTCFGSHFVSNISSISLFECSSSSSCEGNIIDISSSTTSAILCSVSSSCQEMIVNVNNTTNFSLECTVTGSCTNIKINIRNTNQAIIKCYGIDSCSGMTIWSDSNDVDVYIYSSNKNIVVDVLSEYKPQHLHCNPNNAYLSLDGSTYNSINSLYDSAKYLFGDSMPCQNVVYKFHSNTIDKIDCEIRYEYFSNDAINDRLIYLKQYMQCFPNIYIDNITSYNCLGTASPTTDPTSDPTNDPTIDPTNDPTTNPTTYPSKTPTQIPTRNPTKSNQYDSFFNIIFLLGNLTGNEIDKHIIQNTINFTKTLQFMLEHSFVEQDEAEIIRLKYSEFWIQILQINDINVNNIEHLDNENQFEIKTSKLPLKIKTKFICSEKDCQHVFDRFNRNILVNNTQSKLRYYFRPNITYMPSEDKIMFSIVNGGISDIKKLNPIISNPWLDPVILALLSFVGFMALISIISLLHKKGKLPIKIPFSIIVDDSKWVVPLILGFQIWDFASDINLSIEMVLTYKLRSNKGDEILFFCTLGSIIFIVVPYVFNLMMACSIKRFVSKNTYASSYYEHRIAVFVAIVCFSGSTFTALQITSSAILGLDIINSGLTDFEIKQLSKFKVFGTIFSENIPQLLIQLVYSFVLGRISPNVVLSFTASSISVIAATLTYIIQQQSGDINKKMYSYKLQFTKTNEIITDDEAKLLSKNKGRTAAISKMIAKIFQTQHKNIQISKQCIITQYGLVFYVVHCLNESELIDPNNDDFVISPKFYVEETYKQYATEFSRKFCVHFKLESNGNIKYIVAIAKSSRLSVSPKNAKIRSVRHLNVMDALSTKTNGKHETNEEEQPTIELQTIGKSNTTSMRGDREEQKEESRTDLILHQIDNNAMKNDSKDIDLSDHQTQKDEQTLTVLAHEVSFEEIASLLNEIDIEDINQHQD